MWTRMKTVGVVAVLGALLVCSEAVAAKVGYLNVGKAFEGYAKTKEQEKKLEVLTEEKQQEREKLVQAIKDMRSELELLSPEGLGAKEEAVEEKLQLGGIFLIYVKPPGCANIFNIGLDFGERQ